MTDDEATDEAITRELHRVLWRLAGLHGAQIGRVLYLAHVTTIKEIAEVGGDELALGVLRDSEKELAQWVLPG